MTITAPVICDTSGLVAAADAADPKHADVVRIMDDMRGPLVVSPLVVAEVDHLLRARLSPGAARVFADDLARGAYELALLTPADIAVCADIDRRYADLGLGLADAHLLVLAKVYGTNLVLSLDQRHLRAVRPLGGRRALRLLPADASPTGA